MKYLSVKETAQKFDISERRVQKLCESGRIEGAKMISNVWVIPNTAQKPVDGRQPILPKGNVSLSQLCKDLSVSVATGRNWIKLGKLKPTGYEKNSPYFSETYIHRLKESIKTGDVAALKSRRNKKYISGNNFYNSYISENSQNRLQIEGLLRMIKEKEVQLENDIVIALLGECTAQFLAQKLHSDSRANMLREYINSKINFDGYNFLIDDLIEDIPDLNAVINEYDYLFGVNYHYEKREDILGLLYLSLRGCGDKKSAGAYFTPTKIVKKLISHLITDNDLGNKTIIDPCCGTGNFLLQLDDSIHFSQVYGNDLDSTSIKLTRVNMALKYGISDKNLLYEHFSQSDYLSSSKSQKFNIIIGNPPWGFDFSEGQKEFLRKKYKSASGTNIESYDVFIEQGMSDLEKDGVISFVLPESILTVKSHSIIRKLIVDSNSFQCVEFLGNVFDNVQCPSIILQFKHSKESGKIRVIAKNGEFLMSRERGFASDVLNFLSDKEYEILDKIDNIAQKVTLKDSAIFALGIVTGNNKKEITTVKTSKNEMILRGGDIYKFGYRESENRIEFNPKRFQQVAPSKYYRAPEKLLYRFISNNLVFAYDNSQRLSLNSCNILIPKLEGLNIKYIMAVLNSRVAQFFYSKRFDSVKVLRSHIEQIPIPSVDTDIQKHIIGFADKLLKSSSKEVYEQLDYEISLLYGLNDKEYNFVKLSVGDIDKYLNE